MATRSHLTLALRSLSYRYHGAKASRLKRREKARPKPGFFVGRNERVNQKRSTPDTE